MELLKIDENVAQRFKTLISSWTLPNDPKESLEFKLIFAALDRDNYQPTLDPEAGAKIPALTLPEDLRREVQHWQEVHDKPLQYLLLPSRCEEVLQKQQPISDGVQCSSTSSCSRVNRTLIANLT